MTSYAKLTDAERKAYMLKSIKEQEKRIMDYSKNVDEKDPFFKGLSKSRVGTFAVNMPILELRKVRI